MDDLQDRVEKFQTLQLPGQPMGIHMGTMYLVNDLWREVERLRGGLKALVDLKNPLPRSAVREACAELLAGASTPQERGDAL